MNVTKNLRKYVNDIGINIAELSRKANVSYANLYNSLSENGEREMRADELISVCMVLKINPMSLCDTEKSA